MKTTLKIDAMGSLHAWIGEVTLNTSRKYMPVNAANGKESDLFIQNDTGDVIDCISNLPEDEQEMLNRGYWIVTENFPSEYFPYE